ncbi:hypothetical protein AAHC03_025595 [Spirometra sp. Aus1]
MLPPGYLAHLTPLFIYFPVFLAVLTMSWLIVLGYTGNSEQLITHSRAVTAVLRLVDKERYIFSSSLDGSLILWSEEEIGGESVWTPNLKMLLYDVDTSDLPPSPISDMRLQMYHSPGNDSVKAVLFALCGNRLFNLTMNLKTLKSIPVSTTLGLCELKERFALKTIDLPVSGFCLTVTEASATEDYATTVLIGTGFGFLLSVKMLSTPTVQKHDVGVSSRSKDSGLITSLLPLRERVVALCGGSLATFDHQGSFLSDITLSESIEASTLTHLCVPVTGTSYVLVARKLVDGEKERSFISLLGIDGTHHSSYMMPESTQVTALRSSERKFGKINETEVLTVVGSSDGLIRFILFDLCTPSNQIASYVIFHKSRYVEHSRTSSLLLKSILAFLCHCQLDLSRFGNPAEAKRQTA